MVSNSAEDVVRRFYRAFADADFVAAKSCFASDALWHLPGKSALAGDHRGWTQICDEFLAKIGPMSGGTFRGEVIDVAVGEHFVVVVQHATASYQGRSLDVTGCQLIRVLDGLIVEVRGHYSDEAALDAFWAD